MTTTPKKAGDRLADDLTDVVREEVSDVRADLAETVQPAAAGLLLVAAGGGCALLAAGAASTTMLRMLESVLPRRLAVAGLAAGYATAATVLAGLGLQRLHAAGGRSQHLAEQLGQAVTETVRRPVRAAGSAARDAAHG